MTVEDIFINAARLFKICKLIDNCGNIRIVEPYMVYTSATGKRLFHCYQLEGYSTSKQVPGWKNPEVSSFVSAIILEQSFSQRPEYNPFNMKMFPKVHFALPTYDGRQR
ncbi:MAG: hypothetical protein JRI66_12860 [Deltaproteobacteria bacterium]|nr:hypothetical protein [Deltaproteobacteria bacterium]